MLILLASLQADGASNDGTPLLGSEDHIPSSRSAGGLTLSIVFLMILMIGLVRLCCPFRLSSRSSSRLMARKSAYERELDELVFYKEEELDSLTMDELRFICSRKGLSVAGNKASLKDRIMLYQDLSGAICLKDLQPEILTRCRLRSEVDRTSTTPEPSSDAGVVRHHLTHWIYGSRWPSSQSSEAADA